MVKNEIPIEFLRFPALVMSAANTFTEVSVNTPVSRTENLAMLIRFIEFQQPLNLDVVAELDSISMQVSKNSKSDITTLDDSDLLALMRNVFKLITSGMLEHRAVHRIDFDNPILYAKTSIFFGMLTAGQGGAKTGYCRLGYTLERVPDKIFIDALVD